ncbi:MAG: tetratricopeptide repeat protein [Rubrivivax sp.]|nr:MAG: tetratricopeptide repeat protein [Rubrivivax sp.]
MFGRQCRRGRGLPGAAPADALHHLRVNLHRARTLLRGWGVEDGLQTEGQQLRLALPTDLAAGAAADMPPPDPADWPPAWRLAGYDGFAQWCGDTAQALHRRWLRDSRVAAAADAATATAPPAREAEHGQLRHSAAPALLLLGEAGAGKTTLLAATFPHAICLRGLEGLHGMPYRPLLDALRTRMPALQAALGDGHGALRPYRLDLARLLPELAPDEPLPPLDALTAQARLVEALTRAFEALTPVLLVDDLQWCDTATVEWLLLLAHGDRLRWRAAARGHEMGEALQMALQPLRSAGRLVTLDLAALTRADLPAVCHARWPERDFGAEQLDRLHALSAGNPFALGELVAAGAPAVPGHDALPQRVRQMVQRRLQALPALARKAVEAAAVFVQPVPEDGLRSLLGLPVGEAGDADWADARDQALAAGMLRRHEPGLTCSHDLIRTATGADIPAARCAALHRHAALWLGHQPGADAMTIAEHWRAAGEPQTALAWRHQGAEQLKARGHYDEARALWQAVADESLDVAQGLRARLELAACDLLEDLARGEAMLLAIQAQLDGVADPDQHRLIEGRLRAALVDNRVFAGDLGQAVRHAARLRELLPALPEGERIHAYEVLIELAMREPDIPAAWALLAKLREAAPRLPTLLSFEGQIHWFGGQVRAAHDALARLLERHPDFCRGITIENDLAVMLHALGDLPQAEAMARRSLQSWAGVAHTETLSLLALASTLTSAGRHAEAEAALQQALALAQTQSSAGFEAEARLRHARLLLQCGRVDAAAQMLAAAAPLLRDSREPLRVSNWVLMSTLVAAALGRAPAGEDLDRLREASARLQHPVVQAREARVDAELALRAGDAAAALAAAERQAAVARGAGMQELATEAALLGLRARTLLGEADDALRPLARDIEAQAAARGYADLRWRAAAWLVAHGGNADDARRARAAADVLRGQERPALFDARTAARREPRGD